MGQQVPHRARRMSGFLTKTLSMTALACKFVAQSCERAAMPVGTTETANMLRKAAAAAGDVFASVCAPSCSFSTVQLILCVVDGGPLARLLFRVR